MSSPEALHEYARQHEGDIDAVVAKLEAHRIDRNEILKVITILADDSPAMVRRDGFTIYRDLENHYDVQFNDETKAAA